LPRSARLFGKRIAAPTLDCPTREQCGQVRHKRAAKRGKRKHSGAGYEEPPTPKPITGRPAEQQERA
jgi:hypothetical protein